MYDNRTTDEIRQQIAHHRRTIAELKSFGVSWALDCHQMRVARHNLKYLTAELERRTCGPCLVPHEDDIQDEQEGT